MNIPGKSRSAFDRTTIDDCPRRPSSTVPSLDTTIAAVSSPASNAVTALAATNPAQFENVMQAIAAELHAQAGQAQGPGSGLLETLADKFQEAANTGATVPLTAEQPRDEETSRLPLGHTPFGMLGQHRHHGHHGHHGLGMHEADASSDLLSRIIDAVNSALNTTQPTTDVTTSDPSNTTSDIATDTATVAATVEDPATTSSPATKTDNREQSSIASVATLPQSSVGSFTVLSSLSAMADSLKTV
jgi:hypothetical protein